MLSLSEPLIGGAICDIVAGLWVMIELGCGAPGNDDGCDIGPMGRMCLIASFAAPAMGC